jgi:hypothetical protein
MEPPGPFSPPPTPSPRGGSRVLPMQFATIGIVAATGIALIVYFFVR